MNNNTATQISKNQEPFGEDHNQVEAGQSEIEAEHDEIEADHLAEPDFELEIFDNSIKIPTEEFLNSEEFPNYCEKVCAHFLSVYGKNEQYEFPEDATSDVYLKVYEWLPRYRGDANIKSIIYTTIRNLFSDVYRRRMAIKRNRIEIDFDDLQGLQAEAVFLDFVTEELENAEVLNLLSDKDRAILEIYSECDLVKAETVRVVKERRIEKDFTVYKLEERIKSIRRKLRNYIS